MNKINFMLNKFEIISKKNLNSDIYKITYKLEKKINIKPGQFIIFLIDKIGWRAYSILDIIDWNVVLIIKKWEKKNGWRWGSKYLCECKIWDKIKWVGPTGNFILQNNNLNKLFLWTGTWFVPLYNQILWNIKNKISNNIKLIFWVRTKKDLFYIKELKELKKQNTNFDFEIYLSSEKTKDFNYWYITQFLTKKNLEEFQEFYICWVPEMINSSTEILKKLSKKNIYFEKY